MASIGDSLLSGVQNLKGQWDSWMSDPANRAALLQTGVALMQPMSVGQNALGQVGQAIGQGAEAKARYEDTQRSEEQVAYDRQQAALNRQFQQEQASRNYGLEARKVATGERNAASLDAYRQQGGRGLSALFARDQDQLSARLWQAAKAEADTSNNSLDAMQEGYVPKVPQDYLGDPAWIAKTTSILNAMPGMPGTTTYATPQATSGGVATTPPPNPQPGKLPASGGAAVSEPTVVNPKTGQRMVVRNGQWVPQ